MTRLKALELFGFKSFADRTRFEFPDGITVVVGPNGSGKSNVVDAIKWVLGEQSVRSLRGREMTDVIFAGSVSRKPLNSAETSLFFDNSARLLPVEADEVQIGRRVYRSGESEYLINGEVCRLRDIRDLFSGTGAATEAYSVIEQGRVDALLMASGKDRRAVFEEAAGITKFRARRTESLRRLERAEQNRQRLADIVGEVAARLETVRHQAARARRRPFPPRTRQRRRARLLERLLLDARRLLGRLAQRGRGLLVVAVLVDLDGGARLVKVAQLLVRLGLGVKVDDGAQHVGVRVPRERLQVVCAEDVDFARAAHAREKLDLLRVARLDERLHRLHLVARLRVLFARDVVEALLL